MLKIFIIFIVLISDSAYAAFSPIYTCPGPFACVISSYMGIQFPDGSQQLTAASGGGGSVTLAPFGSSPNSDGASISGSTLTLQPANNSNPGGVTTGTQTFAGAKTFASTIAASNFSGTSSGTNTGDVSLGTANGLSIPSGQTLSLGTASTSTTGALTSTDWNTFNGKVSGPAGSNTQIQFNNSSSFGGSASLLWNGTTLTTSNLSTTANAVFGGVVNDGSAAKSIDSNNRQLFGSSADLSLDWAAKQLYRDATDVSVDYGNGFLYDSDGRICMAWLISNLVDTASVPSIDWSNRLLFDSDLNNSVDYQNRLLYAEGFPTADWGLGSLFDHLSGTSITWIGRNLVANDGSTVNVDWSDPNGTTIAVLNFTASDPTKWAGSPPTNVSDAINRIAAVVGAVTPIP